MLRVLWIGILAGKGISGIAGNVMMAGEIGGASTGLFDELALLNEIMQNKTTHSLSKEHRKFIDTPAN